MKKETEIILNKKTYERVDDFYKSCKKSACC